MYFASLFCLEARTVIPAYDVLGNNNDSAILKSYSDTLNMLKNWNIANEFHKVYMTCLTQDVSYNIAYYDETGLYFLPIPPDYCRIAWQYPTGDFGFAINMRYFEGKYNFLIDAWGEPFTTMWRNY